MIIFFLIAGECVTLLSSVCSVNSVEFKHVKMKSASADDHFQWRSVIDFLFFCKKSLILVLCILEACGLKLLLKL